MELHKLDSKRLGFKPIKSIIFSENLTPTNQLLAWKGRVEEGLHDSQYMECPGVIRIRRTANERVLSIKK